MRKEIADRKIVCQKCGIEFMAKRPTRRFCTEKCAYLNRYVYKGRKRGKFIPCKLCGKDVWSPPNRFKRYKLRFCSKDHQIQWQKENSFNFPCKICGIKVFTQPSQLTLRTRSTCSKQCRSKLYRLRAEDRRKKFGYTKHQLDRLARYSPEAEAWRKAVFSRDDYTCQTCKVRGGYLEADHIKPFAFFPNLRFEISNGRTLCRKCHDKTKMSAVNMRKLYANK